MASPQIENGYTRIANELLEAYCKRGLSKNAGQIWWYILRRTYGFHAKEAVILFNEIQKGTGIEKTHISRELNRLINSNMIVTQMGNRGKLSYGIKKDYRKWKVLPKRVTVTQRGNKSLPKGVTKITQMGNSDALKDKTNVDLLEPKDNIKDNIKERKKYIKKGIDKFSIFYKTYPRKKAPKDAKKAWAKIVEKLGGMPDELFDIIIGSIEKQKEQWNDAGTEMTYIPYPATWLNKGQWEDEIEAPQEDGVQTWYKQKLKEEENANGPTTLHG